MSPEVRLGVMVGLWGLWMMPFYLNRRRGLGKAAQIDPKARLGVVVVALGFFVANFHGPKVWSQPV
jgi:hypothetical protein